jgi:hypothetical protein
LNPGVLAYELKDVLVTVDKIIRYAVNVEASFEAGLRLRVAPRKFARATCAAHRTNPYLIDAVDAFMCLLTNETGNYLIETAYAEDSMQVRRIMFTGAALVCLLCTGCSSFNHDWRALAITDGSSDGVEGRWDGEWVSDTNGHRGRIRCIITRDGDTYITRYRAVYKKILKFEYTVPLKVTQEADGIAFTGVQDLGLLAGGVYTYKGTIRNNKFDARYDSKYDDGIFKMERLTGDADK